MKKKRTKPSRQDKSNPEWTDAMFAASKPAEEALGKIFGKKKATDFLESNRKRVGRPRKENAKKQVTLRIDPEVLDYFKNQGAGWQSRMNEVLADYIHNG